MSNFWKIYYPVIISCSIIPLSFGSLFRRTKIDGWTKLRIAKTDDESHCSRAKENTTERKLLVNRRAGAIIISRLGQLRFVRRE